MSDVVMYGILGSLIIERYGPGAYFLFCLLLASIFLQIRAQHADQR